MSNLILNGEQVFLDNNGNPLVAGKVYFYEPDTSTPKDTYQDFEQTILNTNPVILDAGGRAVIWGSGAYRQVLTDSLDNEIWDRYTTDGSFIPDNSIQLSQLQQLSANVVIGAISAGDAVQIPMTGSGRNIVAAASVAAQQTLLNLVPGNASGNVVKWSSNDRILGFGSGLVATPSITFDGNLDTGFWSPDSSTISMSIGGTELFRWNAVTGMSKNFGSTPGLTDVFQIKTDCSLVTSSANAHYVYAVASTQLVFRFHSQTTLVGSINVTPTNTAYNTTSDYRLKDNIKSIDNASDLVLKLKPCQFSFKSDENKEIVTGFIAHELQEVLPHAVTGEKDGEEFQQIDQSKLVALLTASLQEALKRIGALENNGKQ